MRILVGRCFLFLCFCLWGQPFAQSEEDQKKSRKAESSFSEEDKQKAVLFMKYDVNKDGKLDDQEKVAMEKDLKERRAELLKRFDADHDGKFSEAERQAAERYLKMARMARLLKKYDANGDGVLDADERAVMEKEMGMSKKNKGDKDNSESVKKKEKR